MGKKLTKEEFIARSKLIHGDKYDYSKVEYKNNKTKVRIICHEKDKFGKEHGEFWQKPNDHLCGYGCPKCGNNFKKTTDEFIKDAIAIHGNIYDYSKVEYVNSHTKVCIICPIHGEFWQTPSNHLGNKSKCPYCVCANKSQMEENVKDILEKNKVSFERQKTFEWLKYHKHMFLDFYSEKYNFAIEVQGEQHFRPIKLFGGEEEFKIRIKRDEIKKNLCESHGIKMFYITKKDKTLKDVLEYVHETNNKKWP